MVLNVKKGLTRSACGSGLATARRGEAEMSALPGSDVLLTKAMQDDTNFTMRLLDPREAVMRGSRFQPTRSESKFVCISDVQTVGSEDHQPA